MSISAFSQVEEAHQRLISSGYRDLKIFEALGVHPKDVAAQASLANIVTLIAKEAIKPVYDPDSQMIHYCDGAGVPKAVFKPGLARACDETFMRRIFHKMGSSDSSIPAMIASFDFSSLGPVLAKDLNPDAFDSCDLDSYDSGSEDEDFHSLSSSFSLEIESSVYEDFDPAHISEFPFAMEELRSGIKAQYLPTLADGSGSQFARADDKLLLNGVLLGVLEPWVEQKAPATRLELVKTLLLAAITGGRDIKSDALLGSTLIDTEESMATESNGSQVPRPSVHIPALDDPIAQQILSPDEVKQLIALVNSWDVEDLLSYTRAQKHAYKICEIEDLAVSENPDEPIVHKIAAHGLTFMLEGSMREKEFFPRISSGEDCLYAKGQVKAFKARLERIKGALNNLDGSEESDWPEVNLWGLVNIIDPHYGQFCETVSKARQAALSKGLTGLNPQEDRVLYIDGQEEYFVEALAQNAGRMTLKASGRARAASAPEEIIDQNRRAHSPPPLAKAASAEANLLSDRVFKFIPAANLDAKDSN